ncbi:hypothetical protein KKF61_02400 [Patescibacteria group bacterium]|nr:hypothetical protein [Patescibacteria group bacterium]MBU0963626.1 hypothetical protein [Patescibacteria group bacterium]
MDFIIFDPNSFISNLPSANNPFSAMFYIIVSGGWILFIPVFIWGFWTGWVEYIRNKYDEKLEFIVLAIDIPKDNEQTPKAVEHIFSHIYGIKKTGTLVQRYINGYNQPGISLEIVSIEGYIQFLIRTPVKFRDLIEAAIYAQYPEAEITEVEDYVDGIPKPLEYPHEEWDFYGTEYRLVKDELYPIKTYPSFEHSLSQKLLDPMASLLEILSRMGPGEQLWLQLVIAPVSGKWRENGIKLINKLIGKKGDKKKGGDLSYFPREISRGIVESFTASIVPSSEMGSEKQKTEREWPSMMQHLSPDEKDIIEAIGMKMSKLGYKSKIRMIYASKKDAFNKGKGISAIHGAFQQFSTMNFNGIRENKKTRTKVYYMFKKYRLLARKRRILWAFRYRSMKRGRKGFILNTEELATLWHFPTMDVKAPSIQMVDAKKSQPPSELPLESSVPIPARHKAITQKGAAPPNLPTG